MTSSPYVLSFEGKVVLVTGAAGGIGRAVSDASAKLGALVVRGDIDERVLGTLDAGESEAAGTVSMIADATDADDCAALVALAHEKFGRLDVVVNNAGICPSDLTVETTTESEWDRVLDVNLKSAYLVSRAAVPLLRSSGGGVIVNVSSVHALASSPGMTPYAAAKGGLLAMTRVMALDLAVDLIRVVAVLPGATDTPMLRNHADAAGMTFEELGFSHEPQVIGRVASAEELAQVILFAGSPLASAITGSAIVADTGLLASF